MNTRQIAISLCITIMVPSAAWAETNNQPPLRGSKTDNATRLPEVLVVDTPIIEGNTVNRLGSQVTTVSEQQIEDLNAQDLQSALRETPGLVVSHFNPVGSFGGAEGGAVFIRGMGASRPGAEIQLAIDGIANYNSLWTHPLLDMLSVDIAQRIDVYKGAQPVLYGNMAFGVVDMITKHQTAPGFTTSVEGAYGSYDTWTEVAEHGGKVDNFDYYLLESYRSSDGNRPHAAGELQNYFGRIGYALNANWEAHLVFNRTDNWADDPGPSPELVPPSQAFTNGRFNDEDYLTIATLANHYEIVDGYVKAYWNGGTLDWVDQYDTATELNDMDTKTDYDNYGVKTRETFKPWAGGELMAGTDFDFISGKYREVKPGKLTVFPRDTFQIISPYLALSQRWEFNDDIYILPSAGFRYFNHDVFADEFGPQAGIVLGLKDTEFHASYARGVNYPGIFVEAFPPGNNLYHSLDAETLDHYEVGASQRLDDLAQLDLTLFYDGGSNRIVTVSPPFPPVWKNIGSFHTKGLETTVTVTPIDDLALFGGFTVLEAHPTDLPYTPNWTASAGTTYRFLRQFKLNVDCQFVDHLNAFSRARNISAVNTTRIDSYFLLNAKLTYDFKLPWWTRGGQIFLAGQNLTDADYQQVPGYPMPGINGMGGVKLWLF
jgi:outer membrane cobalamin receptor